jgi:flagellar protein FlaG
MDSGIKATVRPLTPDNTVSLKDAFSRGAAGPIDRQDVSFDGKASPADSSQKVEQVIDQEQLQAAVAKVSSYVQSLSRSLDIRSDDRTGDTVIQVFDKSTDELIRQIPSEEVLAISAAISEQLDVLQLMGEEGARGLLLETRS